MDTLRFLLAIVLTIAVVIVTNLLFQPPPPAEEPAAEEPVPEARAPEARAPDAEPEPRPEPEPPPADTEPEPAPADTALALPDAVQEPEEAPPAAPADTVLVSSSLYRYAFSTRGAAVVQAALPRFDSDTRDGPVELVDEDEGPLISYRLRVGDEVVDLERLAFRADPAEPIRVEAGERRTLRFVHADPENRFGVEIRYTFDGDDYTVNVEGRVAGVEQPAQLLVDIGPTLAVNEADADEDLRALGYAVNSTEEGIHSVSIPDVEARRIEEGPLRWVALKNKYFLVAVLREAVDEGGYFGGAIAEDVPGEYNARVTATLPVGRDQRFGYRLYMGPQEYDRLAALAEGLEDVNPYGWRILRPIIRPLAHLFTWMLVRLQQLLDIAYGWVLILFGFLIQVVLWPLYAKAARSQIQNMELQPILKQIQEKYKDKPEKLQKEMMRLYREEGFNPLGGCLPMLIPFPVLITLFFVFQNTIEFRGVEFLWLPDLSRPDPLYILPLILGASMFALQWLSRRSMKTDNPQMKMLMWIMPAFMVIIFLNLASGLNLYYAASNVASVPRQILIMRERRRASGAASERS